MFHHKTESFANKIEIVLNQPIYKTIVKGLSTFKLRNKEELCGDDPFVEIGDEYYGEVSEEGLANAYAFIQTINQTPLRNRQKVSDALKEFIDKQDICYRQALHYLTKRDFTEAVNLFASEIIAQLRAERYDLLSYKVWNCFSHAFDGFINVNTRVNYLVHKNSHLSKRSGLTEKHLKYKQFTKLLKAHGCKFISHKGKHAKWEAPNGQRFPLPRHPKDLGKGLKAVILKQIGWQGTYQDFLAEYS